MPKSDEDMAVRIDAGKGEDEKCAWAFTPARTRGIIQVTVEDVGSVIFDFCDCKFS
jgi:hypothetical protein